MDLYGLTIHEAHELLKERQISSVDLTAAVFERIEKVEEKVSAYLTLARDRAMAEAEVGDDVFGEGCRRADWTGSMGTPDRHPPGHQRYPLYGRHQDDVRIQDIGKFHPSV